jgi:hypothetical protein
MAIVTSKTLIRAVYVTLLAASMAMEAQVTAPAQGNPPPAGVPVPQPVLIDFAPVVNQLQQTTVAMSLDISRLRIEKWKADSTAKRQAQADADSITRNVTTALPTIMDEVRAKPQNLAAAFKLYRNVNALYDVFSGLTVSAGTFGPKSEYAALAGDAEKLDGIRRDIGDKVGSLAAATDTEIARLRTEIASQTPPPAPKKIVIDEEEPKKKPVRKKPVKKPVESKPPDNAATAPTTKGP